MSMNNRYVMGLFNDESLTVSALEALKSSPWPLHRVHGPYPSHKILHALNFRKSRVGYFTLAGGILGFLSGYALTTFASVQWGLVVSGKPVVSLLPFFVVGYEMTILFGVLGTVLGLLITTRIPDRKSIKLYDERCSGEHFGIIARCDPGKQEELAAFFREQGGEVQMFEDEETG